MSSSLGLHSDAPLVSCCGSFPFLPFFDVSLSRELTRIETRQTIAPGLCVGCESNCVVVEVPFEDSSFRVAAVSGDSRPYLTQIYDILTNQRISRCVGHLGPVCGLTCLPSPSFSSSPLIVSGGERTAFLSDDSRSQLFVFDAVQGKKLGELQHPPYRIAQILHVPEWKNQDVFVAGRSFGPVLWRYDLETQQRIGRYQCVALKSFGFVNGVSASVSRRLLFSVQGDPRRTSAGVWSRDEYAVCQIEISLPDVGHCCSFVEDRDLLLVGLGDGTVGLWDIRKPGERMNSSNELFSLHSVDSIAPVGDSLVAVSGGSVIALWNFESGLLIRESQLVLGDRVRSLCHFDSDQDWSFCSGEGWSERWEYGMKKLRERSVSVACLLLVRDLEFLVCVWMLAGQ